MNQGHRSHRGTGTGSQGDRHGVRFFPFNINLAGIIPGEVSFSFRSQGDRHGVYHGDRPPVSRGQTP